MSPKLVRILGIWIFCVDLLVGLLLIFMTVGESSLTLGDVFSGSVPGEISYTYSRPYAPYGFLIIIIGVAFLVGLNMLARRMERSKSNL
jgi:hypothetical protein